MSSRSILQIGILIFTTSYCSTYDVYFEPGVERMSEIDRNTVEDFLNRRRTVVIEVNDQVEEVCNMTIRPNHRPLFGHLQNGTRVEIQQDQEQRLEATFVECIHTGRKTCHGIDHHRYASECVTVFENRPAFIRIADTISDFVPATVRVPVTCECRLRQQTVRYVRRR